MTTRSSNWWSRCSTPKGYLATCYITGTAAEAALLREPPDLILLDLRLEERDTGWTLLQTFRQAPALRAVPVIVCSADVAFLRANAERLRELGCAVLPKPFDLDTLLGLVAAGLSSDGAAPSSRQARS